MKASKRDLIVCENCHSLVEHELNTLIHQIFANNQEAISNVNNINLYDLITSYEKSILWLQNKLLNLPVKHDTLHNTLKEEYRMAYNEYLPNLEKVNILSVDDSEDNLKVLEILLRNTGAHINSATTGLDGINQFKNDKYNLIFLDISLPDIDGDEVAKEIRNYENTHDMERTPIIAVTAHTYFQESKSYKTELFDECITKPFTKISLLDCLYTYCRREDISLNASENSLNNIDMSEYIETFITNKNKKLNSALNALDKSDFETVKKFGHELKGDSIPYGYPSLSYLGARIEDLLIKKQHPDNEKIKMLLKRVALILGRGPSKAKSVNAN